LEEGALLKDTDLLRRIIPDFDPLWERDAIAAAYTELALHAKGKNRKAEARDAAERLYALNHGALRQNGIALPVELSIDAVETPNPAKTERVLRRTLRKMGIDVTPAPGSNRTVTGGDGSTPILPNRFRLSITVSGGGALCELYDGGRGVNVFRRSIPLGSLSGTDISAFARILGDGIFVVDGK
jgi:hypothetical protein